MVFVSFVAITHKLHFVQHSMQDHLGSVLSRMPTEVSLALLPTGAGMSLLPYSMLSQHGKHLESFSHTIRPRPSHKTKKFIQADAIDRMGPTSVDRSSEIHSLNKTGNANSR